MLNVKLPNVSTAKVIQIEEKESHYFAFVETNLFFFNDKYIT